MTAKSRMCWRSLARVWLMSEGSAPNDMGTSLFISGPFCNTNVVHARVMFSASVPATSTCLTASWMLSHVCLVAKDAMPPGTSKVAKGAAAVSNFLDCSSAEFTRSLSSSTSALAHSSISFRFASSAAFFSSTKRRLASIISMHLPAASTALSASSLNFLNWFPARVCSLPRTASSSSFSVAKLSGVAKRTFWITGMTAFTARSSSAFFISSSNRRLLSSSAFFFLASSACLLRSSSSLFLSSSICACWCCCCDTCHCSIC
mmetsp:Transcript_117658/g.228745  ORF Transcript_117658/g.228745 Transcript_117658/m.228745 type:complete len:261 (+) Transcript_117658:1459-2241(+)